MGNHGAGAQWRRRFAAMAGMPNRFDDRRCGYMASAPIFTAWRG